MLSRIEKGFDTRQTLNIVPQALEIFDRVDLFYVWGFPGETIDDFRQSLFQMISFRMMGARVLPSLISLLPQTVLYKELPDKEKLEFCPGLLPEFVYTGHELCLGTELEIPSQHQHIFDLVRHNVDLFPGFFLYEPRHNVYPKLKLLQEFGFYPETKRESADYESCGAHSPNN